MKTSSVVLELTVDEMQALRLAVEYSKRAVTDSPDNPRELKEKKLAILDSLLGKLPRSIPIGN